MSSNRPQPPTLDDIRALYSTLHSVYLPSDKWHSITRRWIARFVREEFREAHCDDRRAILNLGAGGESYGLHHRRLVDVDLHHKENSNGFPRITGDLHALPLATSSFDACICVGSVLNHCDAARILSEVGRVMKAGGMLVLEFETSSSLDLLLSGSFNESATVVTTFYQDRHIRLWAYSEQYICRLLDAAGFTVVHRSAKHYLSGLAYLICRNSNVAATLHVFDGIAARLPIVRNTPAHIIFSCRKREVRHQATRAASQVMPCHIK